MNHGLASFDYLTLQQEWTDYLTGQCGYEEAPASLVAELSRQHTVRFNEELSGTGLRWNQVDGTFHLHGPVPPGVDLSQFVLPYETLNGAWAAAFDAVSETLSETEQLLSD